MRSGFEHLGAGVDQSAFLASLSGTIPAALSQRWSSAPTRAELQIGGVWHTAGELDAMTRASAAKLAALGAKPGDRLVLCAQSPAKFVPVYLGALRSGVIVVPANIAYREAELEHLVRDSDACLALVEEAERREGLRSVLQNAHRAVVADVDLGEVAGSSSLPALDASAANDTALIAYTSGTTGKPKGAEISHANLVACSRMVAAAWRWTASDRLLITLPLFHVHGLCVGLNSTLLVGATAVLHDRFDVDGVFDALRAESITMFFGVPTMYSRLERSSRLPELAALRLCVSGSAALPAELWERVRDASGQEILERYGLTEALMCLSNPYEGDRRAGTVGFPFPGVEARLAADGEVQLRGPNIFKGYWRNEAATASAFTDDGWLRTGDLAEDDQGYVRILGRSKELIITGGLNVYPREVEDALCTLPGVLEAAVVGERDPEWGERIVGYVVIDESAVARLRGEGSVEDTLVAAMRERLAAFKCPRRVHVVSALPRNAMGKVQKHLLAPP